PYELPREVSVVGTDSWRGYRELSRAPDADRPRGERAFVARRQDIGRHQGADGASGQTAAGRNGAVTRSRRIRGSFVRGGGRAAVSAFQRLAAIAGARRVGVRRIPADVSAAVAAPRAAAAARRRETAGRSDAVVSIVSATRCDSRGGAARDVVR